MLLREGALAESSITGLTGTIGHNTLTINPFSYLGTGSGEGASWAVGAEQGSEVK